MSHHCQHCAAKQENFSQKVRKYLPLAVAFSSVLIWTLVHQALVGFNLHNAMHDFMGAFFLLFGALKVFSWKGFAKSYRRYDPVAKYSPLYAYLYPAVEVFLGVMYFFKLGEELFLNTLTILILGSATIGVLGVLKRGETVQCACVGSYFAVPISWFTVFENFLMIGMAIYMVAVWGPF